MAGDDQSYRPDEETVKKIGLLVGQEAYRIFSEAQFEPDPELTAQGWERRFMGDARQVKEALELYAELGYETLTQPVTPAALSNDCESCKVVVMFQFQHVYIRKKQTD